MSVVAASAARDDRAQNARLVPAVLVAGAGVFVTVLTYAVSWNSTIIQDPHASAISRTLLVGVWIGVGLLMIWRQVEPSLAVLVAGTGFLFGLVALNGIDDAAVYTVGRILQSVVLLYVAYVILRFGQDLFGAPVARRLVGGLAAALAVLWVLTLPIAEKLPPSGQFSYCGDRCPPNAFNVVTWPGPADVLGFLITLTTAVALAGVTLLLFAGARKAPPRQQYAFAPLIYALALWAFSYVVFTVTRSATWEGLDTLLRFVAAVGAIGTPFALFVAQGRRRSFAADRVETLVTAGADTSPAHVLDLVRDGLGDPSAVLAVLDDDLGYLVDASVNRVDVDAGPGRILVSRESRVVAALVYDPAASDEAAARALAGAALTILENDRLFDDLRASRARAAAAAETERRRLERDLHDGAQQHLLSLRLRLAEIERNTDQDTAAKLAAVDADLAAALEELRAIAHGIYPPVLRERGVPDALRARALHIPVGLTVDADGVGRFDPSAELAVYFCALEAVQNATRHGGDGVVVEITFARDGGDVAFAVRDDGAGFDVRTVRGGAGLTSMRDRLDAIGGRLEIDSEPGRGTTVRGRVPA